MSAGHRLKLLDQVRQALRVRHYSTRTEKAYVGWIRRFVVFHGIRHPAELGEPEVAQFLTSLAEDGGVSPSTQNQAASALLFLYRKVLNRKIERFAGVVRAKISRRTPVVLTRDEVAAVLRGIRCRAVHVLSAIWLPALARGNRLCEGGRR